MGGNGYHCPLYLVRIIKFYYSIDTGLPVLGCLEVQWIIK